MARLSIQLPGDALAALGDLSAREWRSPQDQATVLILEGLQRRGLADAPSARDEALPTHTISRDPEAVAR